MNYRVQYRYKKNGKTYRHTDEIFADSANEATDIIRIEYGDLDDMRVEGVWVERPATWDACEFD